MFNNVNIDNIIRSKSAIGLELTLLSNDAYEINLVELKKEKSSIVTEKKGKGIQQLEDLSSEIDSQTPIVLLINGKGIIHRKIAYSTTDTKASLLNKVLPNANESEFDIQKTILNESELFLSVIRTSALTEIIAAFKKAGFENIQNLLLGPFVINKLIPLIGSQQLANDQFLFENYQINLNAGQLSDFSVTNKVTSQSVNIGGEFIQSNFLLPFAAAMSFYVGEEAGISSSNLLNSTKEEFGQSQRFRVFGWGLLIAVFSVLLINYFAFSYYWSKSTEMNAVVSLNQADVERYNSLKAEFTAKKEFLNTHGLLESSRTSLYADELAAILPASIQWTGVNIHPLQKKKRGADDEGLQFSKNKITITGKSKRSTELNEWLKKVKQKTWISAVTLVDYKQEQANSPGEFMLEIELAE